MCTTPQRCVVVFLKYLEVYVWVGVRAPNENQSHYRPLQAARKNFVKPFEPIKQGLFCYFYFQKPLFL